MIDTDEKVKLVSFFTVYNIYACVRACVRACVHFIRGVNINKINYIIIKIK